MRLFIVVLVVLSFAAVAFSANAAFPTWVTHCLICNDRTKSCPCDGYAEFKQVCGTGDTYKSQFDKYQGNFVSEAVDDARAFKCVTGNIANISVIPPYQSGKATYNSLVGKVLPTTISTQLKLHSKDVSGVGWFYLVNVPYIPAFYIRDRNVLMFCGWKDNICSTYALRILTGFDALANFETVSTAITNYNDFTVTINAANFKPPTSVEVAPRLEVSCPSDKCSSSSCSCSSTSYTIKTFQVNSVANRDVCSGGGINWNQWFGNEIAATGAGQRTDAFVSCPSATVGKLTLSGSAQRRELHYKQSYPFPLSTAATMNLPTTSDASLNHVFYSIKGTPVWFYRNRVVSVCVLDPSTYSCHGYRQTAVTALDISNASVSTTVKYESDTFYIKVTIAGSSVSTSVHTSEFEKKVSSSSSSSGTSDDEEGGLS